MTIAEAGQLVIEALMMGQGGESFVFDMGEPMKIIDLAKKMIALNGYKVDKDIEIKITGVCLFSCIIWTLVGVYMGDSKVIFGSGVGVAISSLSILIYTFLSFI